MNTLTVCVCDLSYREELTFSVAAGLGQALAVGQHGRVGHGDAHGAALLAGLVLERDDQSREKT